MIAAFVQAVPAEGADHLGVPDFLLLMAVILVTAKVLGELAERIGQPAVLGELMAGVILGGSVAGVLDPAPEVIHLIAELGVVLLLFQIGLETNLSRLVQVGAASLVVAIVGVALPFGGGFVAARLLGLGLIPAVVCGAALTATSVGITARVLSDLGRLQDAESQIVLGAAVIDDIIGLIILAVVAQMADGGTVSVSRIGVIALVAFGFVAQVVLLGRLLVPRLFDALSRMGREETLATMALAFGLAIAVLADRVGSAPIVGAFAAGLVLAPTRHAKRIEHGVVRLGVFFVPIFFVVVGAAVDVRTFADLDVLVIGGSLIVVAILGKVAAGYAPVWYRGRKLVIGVGMMPRGEVGLIFAQTGLATGALTPGLFSALTLMVMVTTFLAPPILKLLLGPAGPPTEDAGGVAEIVTEA
jgi:Kef-type K+ transport system membrane component KefB